MRSISPMWGFVALILAAVLASSLISSKHHNDGAIPPAEQARIDEEKQIEEANKYNATHKTPPADNKKSATNKTSPKTLSVDETTPTATPDTTTMTFDQAKEGAVKATMQVQGRGKIVMELYPKAAPKTVAHFLDLCRKHFYDGIKFHRLEAGFVVQGGDPESKNAAVDEFDAKGIGTHGSGTTTVPLEAHLLHKKYSIGQARSQALDSGDSQFYFNLNDNTALDGKYCVFGMVVEGQDVVDKIEKGDVITSLTPL